MSDIYLKHVVDTDANIVGDADFTAGKMAISSDGHKLVYKTGTTAYRAAVEGGSPTFVTLGATDLVASGDVTAVNVDASGNVDAVDGDFTGDITAVNATLTGDIGAVNGTFTGDVGAVAGDFTGDITAVNADVSGVIKVDSVQVVGPRVIDERADDVANSGDATTDGLIDALRDAMIAHGLLAAS
jgi:glycine cleavage system H lipoate-binding protein